MRIAIAIILGCVGCGGQMYTESDYVYRGVYVFLTETDQGPEKIQFMEATDWYVRQFIKEFGGSESEAWEVLEGHRVDFWDEVKRRGDFYVFGLYYVDDYKIGLWWNECLAWGSLAHEMAHALHYYLRGIYLDKHHADKLIWEAVLDMKHKSINNHLGEYCPEVHYALTQKDPVGSHADYGLAQD